MDCRPGSVRWDQTIKKAMDHNLTGTKKNPGRRAKIGLLSLALIIGLVWTQFDIYRIEGNSMLPAVRDGDIILVWKAPRELIQPGDIIVFENPLPVNYTRKLVKRVLARGNQSYEWDKEKGRFAREGKWLSESYVKFPATGRRRPVTMAGSQYDLPETVRALGKSAVTAFREGLPPRGQVPPGAFLVAGDNRDHSSDSRHFGFLPADLVIGKVVHRISGKRKSSAD